jgi:surfeit locus 1 family protein
MALFAALGAAVLVSLGVWQLQRAAWKDEVIARMDARLSDAPAPLPAEPDAEAHAFRAVRLTGEVAGPPVPVFSTWRGAGAGYRIVVPLMTEDGRRIPVDLGVSEGAEAALPGGPLAVEGHLHWPMESQGDPADEVWTGRDVAALADRLDAEAALVVAGTVSPPVPGVVPVPMDTAGIRDNHMGYAIQWFGLAAVWGGMAAAFLWRGPPRGRPA